MTYSVKVHRDSPRIESSARSTIFIRGMFDKPMYPIRIRSNV
jgi:hypothetical protein